MNTSNDSSLNSAYILDNSAYILDIASTTINAVLGLPINAGILWLVFTGAAGTMASEIFTLNLSVCEILFSLLHVVVHIKIIPKLILFTFGILYTGRPVFQTCICIERFMAVVLPVLFLKYKPMRYRAGCSVVCWVAIIAISIVTVQFGYTVPVYYLYLGLCVFYMSVMLLCSLAVLIALKRPGPGDKGPGPGGTGRERDRDNGMKRRAFIIICLIMVSFVATYLSCFIFVVILDSQGKLLSDEMYSKNVIMVSITVITGFVQPLLYLCQKTGRLPCIKPVQQ